MGAAYVDHPEGGTGFWELGADLAQAVQVPQLLLLLLLLAGPSLPPLAQHAAQGGLQQRLLPLCLLWWSAGLQSARASKQL